MELIYSRNPSFCDDCKMVNVSSTYLFHKTGGCGADLIASTSKLSMYMLATMGLKGDPIAAPSTCSLKLPLEAEVCTGNAELQKTYDVIYG